MMSRTLAALLLSFACIGVIHAQVRLTPDEAEKLVIEKPEPIYPPIAKAAGAQGIVRIEAVVSEQGLTIAAKAITGHPLLQTAAVNAVKKRRYKAHMVNGNAVSFVTDIYIRFPSGPITGSEKQEYERGEELAQQYFAESTKCRDLARAQKWKEAEHTCAVVVHIADQLSDSRALERMGAYELFGHVLQGQKRYQEALEYYDRARDAVKSKLTETDAELGRLYGDMAITHHLLRDLDKARELYKKAEQILQAAHGSIGRDNPDDEWVKETRQGYIKSLKQLLQYHLVAAEDAGVIAEVEEIKKRLNSLP